MCVRFTFGSSVVDCKRQMMQGMQTSNSKVEEISWLKDNY